MLDEKAVPIPRMRLQGDTAITVEFDERPDITRFIHAFDIALNNLDLPGVIETVPTYRATTIHIDPLIADLATIRTAVLNVAAIDTAEVPTGRVWEVPLYYGGNFGYDLEYVASQAGMTCEDCISIHASAEYLVAMIGFLPGFSYLSGLDRRLSTPRRSEPRQKIPASSISIGGEQTAIGSLEGPSGWHVIGRTPVRPFQPGRAPEFLFAQGDRIRFRRISGPEWRTLDREAERGAKVAECLDDDGA